MEKPTVSLNILPVGTCVRLRKAHAGLPAGTFGVCYENFLMHNVKAASFLFASGSADDFSEISLQEKLEIVGFCESLKHYKAHNLATVLSDFKRGVFDQAFRQG